MQSRERAYKLEVPTRQKAQTFQGWWLSLLEVLRQSHKLDMLLSTRTGAVYAWLQRNGVPAEHEREVYGEEWQRILMSYLRASGNWNHGPMGTILTSGRVPELTRMLAVLGVSGVAFGEPRNLIPWNAEKVMGALPLGSWVMVDRMGHATAGMVASATSLSVYEQTTGELVIYSVGREGLASLKGAVVNWLLPISLY
ncbi:MAG: hypothetical protein ABW123_27715 [Cystobacter sp.]